MLETIKISGKSQGFFFYVLTKSENPCLHICFSCLGEATSWWKMFRLALNLFACTQSCDWITILHYQMWNCIMCTQCWKCANCLQQLTWNFRNLSEKNQGTLAYDVDNICCDLFLPVIVSFVVMFIGTTDIANGLGSVLKLKNDWWIEQ